jgi:hypothetical protein
MTIFIEPSKSLDETLFDVRGGYETRLALTEHSISIPGDKVVNRIQHDRRKNAGRTQHLPWPTELARDEDRRSALRERRNARRSVVRDDVKGIQIAGITPEPLNHRLADWTLQRCEVEDCPVVVDQ